MATFNFRGRSFQLPDAGRTTPRRTSSLVPSPTPLAQQEEQTPSPFSPASPRTFSPTNPYGVPTTRETFDTSPYEPSSTRTPQQSTTFAPFDPSQRNTQLATLGGGEDAYSWLPKSEGTGLGSAMYNRYLRPMVSPTGAAVLGGGIAATVAFPVAATYALGAAGVGVAGYAASQMGKEWGEYQEAKKSGDEAQINRELSDVIMGGVDIVGGAVVSPLAIYKGVTRAKHLEQAAISTKAIGKKAAEILSEWNKKARLKMEKEGIKYKEAKEVTGELLGRLHRIKLS